MIVVLTDAARSDLVAIGRYIKADNPRRAESFVAELELRCHQLGTMPKAFALVPRHERSGVRRRPYRDYLIFYRVAQDRVEVLHTFTVLATTTPCCFPKIDRTRGKSLDSAAVAAR